VPVVDGYYADNPATRGFHDLGAKYWAHSVRESVLFRSLMSQNGTICNYGA
jgi:hypothetical protein